jgi:putative hemolysin
MISIILIVVFFFGVAFFAGTELGMVSLDKSKLTMEAEKDRRKKKIYEFVTNPDNVLGTTLIGTNLSLVIVSSLFTAFVVQRGYLTTAQATIILSFLVLVFGDILPKTIFRQNPYQKIPKVFGIIKFSARLFRPFIWLISKFNNAIFKLFGLKARKPNGIFTKEDLAYLLREVAKEGEVTEENHELVKDVLDFRDLTAKNIMTPRTNITAVHQDAPLREVIELAREKGYTRFPVYSKGLDHIEGMLVIHDILRAKDLSEPVKNYMQEAFFVPEIMKASVLLNELQLHKKPLAVVVDEYGGTAGIISIEDLLEELVGNIEDEYDAEEKDIYKLNENTLIVDGDVELERLIEDYGLDLEKGDYETIAGYLIYKAEVIPKYDEKIRVKNYEFVIKQVSSKKIEKVLIKILPEDENPDSQKVSQNISDWPRRHKETNPKFELLNPK